MESTGSKLFWNHYESHLCSSMKSLRTGTEFCDVTLVCENSQVQAHKVILASFSKFFKRVLEANPHPHPLIYLKGVKMKDMLSILDYMYIGEVHVIEGDKDNLLEEFKDLEVIGFISSKIEVNLEPPSDSAQVETRNNNDQHQIEAPAQSKKPVDPACKVFVGGLGQGCDENDLFKVFSPYNPVNVWIRGRVVTMSFGFVTMATPGDAQKSVRKLHGTKICGYNITFERHRDCGRRSRERSLSSRKEFGVRGGRSRERSRSPRKENGGRGGRRHEKSRSPRKDFGGGRRGRSRDRSRSPRKEKRSRSEVPVPEKSDHKRKERKSEKEKERKERPEKSDLVVPEKRMKVVEEDVMKSLGSPGKEFRGLGERNRKRSRSPANSIKEKLSAAEERRLSMDSLRSQSIQIQHAKIGQVNQKKEDMVAEKSSKVKEEVENKLKTAEEKRIALQEKVNEHMNKIEKAHKEQEEVGPKESAKVEAELAVKFQKADNLKEKQDKALQEKLAEKNRKAEIVRENK